LVFADAFLSYRDRVFDLKLDIFGVRSGQR
jgi:hypothetical protein